MQRKCKKNATKFANQAHKAYKNDFFGTEADSEQRLVEVPKGDGSTPSCPILQRKRESTPESKSVVRTENNYQIHT